MCVFFQPTVKAETGSICCIVILVTFYLATTSGSLKRSFFHFISCVCHPGSHPQMVFVKQQDEVSELSVPWGTCFLPGAWCFDEQQLFKVQEARLLYKKMHPRYLQSLNKIDILMQNNIVCFFFGRL